MNKNIQRGLVMAGVLTVVSGSASADPIVVTAITDGIAAAGVALLAVIGALLALSTSIFGVSKVYSFIKRKAGA